MTAFGNKVATAGIALVSVGAIAIAPAVQPPPPPAAPAVRLAAATASPLAQPLAQQTNAIGALLRLDLGRFIIPPSAGQPFPTPQFPGPSPAPTDFAGTIKNTYVAIEPWVHYGFQLAQYAVGWVPYVGWLSPQIDIFYHFGERIVRSVVFNSADWLWGPLPFVQGLANIAVDSWNSLVQLGIDQWNFWLPPLPPLPPFPLAAQQAQSAAADTLVPSDQPAVSRSARPDPLGHILISLRHALTGPDTVAPNEKGLQDADLQEAESAPIDVQQAGTSANSKDELDGRADLPRADITPTNADETKANPPVGAPSPPLTAPRKAKPFDKRPKPALATSSRSSQPSNESVGTPEPAKNRFDTPKKRRVTGSPSGSTETSAGSTPSRAPSAASGATVD